MSELVFLVLGIMLGISLTVVSVDPPTWVKAQGMCEANGGVEEYQANLLGNPNVTCVNGARFTLREKG